MVFSRLIGKEWIYTAFYIFIINFTDSYKFKAWKEEFYSKLTELYQICQGICAIKEL